MASHMYGTDVVVEAKKEDAARRRIAARQRQIPIVSSRARGDGWPEGPRQGVGDRCDRMLPA